MSEPPSDPVAAMIADLEESIEGLAIYAAAARWAGRRNHGKQPQARDGRPADDRNDPRLEFARFYARALPLVERRPEQFGGLLDGLPVPGEPGLSLLALLTRLRCPKPSANKSAPKLTAPERAIVEVVQRSMTGQPLETKAIAKAVGCSEKILHKSERYKTTLELVRAWSTPPRGTKDATTGRVEAYSEEED